MYHKYYHNSLYVIQFTSATVTLSAQHNIPYILSQQSVYNTVYICHSYLLCPAQCTINFITRVYMLYSLNLPQLPSQYNTLYHIYYHNNLYIIQFTSASVTLSAQHNIPYILSQQSVYNTVYICHSYPLFPAQCTINIITTVYI
jgi:hypothetical protein